MYPYQLLQDKGVTLLNPTQLWTVAFWKNLAVAVVSVGLTAFVGYLAALQTTPNLHSLEAAGWAALTAAIGYLVHSTGVTATTKQAAKEAAIRESSAGPTV